MENTVRVGVYDSPGAYAAPDIIWENTGIRTRVVEELRHLAEEHGLLKVVLFGSRARGDFRRESDIDLAVSGGNAEMFLLNAEETTSTLLKYDVVNLDHPLRPALREAIEREGKVLFEKV
ncbi:MAG: nucleotidyltransferase domain-containing protein [Oscillospiraceae bacterium]|nr:nucleotidyltransferase domain-containing protein [Clostridia bacterium]MBO5640446.1 nucleotidyltransferase domain-containing protein [Oscillospiraceae bacterium]